MAKKPTKALWSTAYHEAGHAVAAFHLGIKGKSVSIEPIEDSAGHFQHANPLQGIQLDVDGSDRARLRVERLVKVCFAGPIAQRRFNPKGYRTSHASSDFETATGVLMRLTGSTKELEAYAELLHIQTEQMICNRLNWLRIEEVAKALIEQRKLSARQLRTVIRSTIRSTVGTEQLPDGTIRLFSKK